MLTGLLHRRRQQSSLKPSELAEAAILADLAVVIVIVTRLTPLASFSQVLGCFPFAVLAMRHRLKVVSISFWIAFILTFLLAGYGQALKVIVMAVWGAIAGRAIRDRWGWGRSLLWSMTLGWATTSAIKLGLAFTLTRFRELVLEVIANQWGGISQVLKVAVGVANSAIEVFQANPLVLVGLALAIIISRWRESKQPVVLVVAVVVLAAGLAFSPTIPASWIEALDSLVETGVEKWWISIPIAEFGFGLWMTHVVRRLGTPVGNRVERTFGPMDDSDDLSGADIKHNPSAPEPVPISISSTMVRAGDQDLYQIEDLQIEAGEFVILTGPNGAGKSTLFKMLAGMHDDVNLSRPGEVGLGRPSGTVLIGQRPESQVLGARVIDDLRWGFDPGEAAGSTMSESEALRLTGLAGFELRETSTLSGGELQRLVIAGALLRQPKLVLSDESTSMLSPTGRTQVMELLATLARNGSAVVHITHIEAERSHADRVLVIEEQTLVER